MSEDERNDLVGGLVDLSMDLERIDKQIKTCESEIEKFQRQLEVLRAKKGKILKEFETLSQKMNEE